MSHVKNAMFCALAIAWSATGAENVKDGSTTPVRMTREIFQRMSPAEREAFKYKVTGGMIKEPDSQKGKVAFISVQQDLPIAEMRKVVDHLCGEFKGYVIESRELPPMASATSVAELMRIKKESGADIAVILISDEISPTMLAAPEDNWAAVNVRTLAKGLATQQAKDRFYYGRCRKELLRGFAAAAGGLGSIYDKNVMNVAKVSDLDFVDEFLPHDKVKSALNRFKMLGLHPLKMTTYLKACKDGWAPAPTNDVQKAIWEKVRSDKERGPTNPITIPPPKK